jgi:hydroxymethylpyrimidine pyrophosphatase-like HAD family hydrolase
MRRFAGLQLAFQDIDGCLNPANGEDFPPGGVGQLSHAQKSMLHNIGMAMDASDLKAIAINTGRNYEDTAYIVEAIQSKKLTYAILEHSAYAWDLKADKKLNLQQMAKEQEQYDLAQRYEFLNHIPELIPWYRNHGMQRISEKHVPVEDCLDKDANLSIAIPSSMDGDQLLNALKQEIEKDFPDSFHRQLHYCYSNFFVDVLGPVKKADGAQLLARHLDIEESNCVVIGDSLNDIDLFEAFNHGLCPQNSHPIIKNICSKREFHISKMSFGDAILNFYQSV